MSIGTILNIARTGLEASQVAIQTTSLNISNVDTPGYSEQQAVLQEFAKATQWTKKSFAEETQMSLFYGKVADIMAKKGIGLKEMLSRYLERGAKVSGGNGENR